MSNHFGHGYSDMPPNYGTPVRLYDTFNYTDEKNGYTGQDTKPPDEKKDPKDPKDDPLSPLDIVKGGYRYWLAKKAATAPHVDINETLDKLAYMEYVKKQELNQKLMNGTDEIYNKLAFERSERKAFNYKPQGAVYGIQKGQYGGVPCGGFGDSIGQTDPDLVGTLYRPTNVPDRVNTFPNDNLIIGRGRMVPTIEPSPENYNGFSPGSFF